MEARKIAYHFVGSKLRDGRDVPPDGVWLEHNGPVRICERGLHASFDPFDALLFAPGEILCKVEVDEIVDSSQADKFVCRRRRIIARLDATQLLRKFARDQAMSVSHLWNVPSVVLKYLKTGDETLREAAWYAARDTFNLAVKNAFAAIEGEVI